MKKSVHNKENNRIEISTAAILAILLLGFLSIVYQITLKNVVVDIFGIKSDWVVRTLKTDNNLDAPETVDIDWKKEYPFPKDSAYEQVNVILTNNSNNNSSEGNKGGLEKIYSMLDKYSSKYFSLVDECKIVSKGFGKVLGMSLISDSYGDLVFFQPDGRMMAERQYKSVDNEITNINNFAEWLQENDIEYIYVNVPSPVDPEEEDDIIKEGYDVHSNEMADELLEGLEKAGTKYLDIRDCMKEQGKSYTDSFFQDEHHWLPQTGLWAAGEISKYINEYENLVTDDIIFDIDEYDIKTSDEKCMRGYGKIVTSAYAEKTPIDLLYPKFNTDIRKMMPSNGMDITGGFGEVMYYMLAYPTYNVYNHGIGDLKKYENMRENVADTKMLLLTDSYSDVVSPFLACAYSNIDEIDLRCFPGSLQAYIEKNKPDIVITITSCYCINSASDLFEFK